MKKLVISLMVAFSLTANAQNVGTVPPNADGKIFYSWDSDDFSVIHSWVGASNESGIGARIGYSQFSGKQLINGWRYVENNIGSEATTRPHEQFNSKFSANSNVLQLTYQNTSKTHDFKGAIGIRRTDYNTDTNGLDTLLLKMDTALIVRTGAGPTSSESGYFTNEGDIAKSELSGSRDTLVAEAELRLVLTDKLSIGGSIVTDLVESARSVQNGTRSIYVAADVDYLITENLNLSLVIGNTYFTDNNNRSFIRTKTTWTFMPDYGISTYLRTRNQYDSNPGGFNYFSPKSLAQQSVGLMLRKSYDGLVYTIGGEAGFEQVVDVIGIKDAHPIYGWQLGLQTSPRKKTGTTFGASLIGSNASGSSAGGAAYYWYGLNLWLKAPI